jgi:hypothetical protein
MSVILSRRRVTIAATFGLAAYIGLSSVPCNAQGVNPIQSPITGNEDLGDLSLPQQALAQFYRAFNTRDLKMIDENFAHSDDVAIDNHSEVFAAGRMSRIRCMRGSSRVQRTFTLNFGITPFTARATYFGRSVGNVARTVTVKM